MQTSFVKIRTFQSPEDAHFAAAALDQHEISCEVVGDTLATSFSIYGVAVSKVELHVPENDVQKALEVLQELDQQKFNRKHDRWGTDGKLGWVCPTCSEVNELTFDLCWSCTTPQPEEVEKSMLADLEDVPTEVGVDADATGHAAPSDSPYRVMPGARDRAVTFPDAVVADLERRAIRAFFLGLACLPVLLYSLYLSGRLIGTGQAGGRIWTCFLASIVTLLASPLLLGLLL